MSSSPFKGGLAPGGPSFADKAKLQMRRPTPDSDAVASSDDDHDHVPRAPRPANVASGARRPSTGWLHDIQPTRKYSLPSVALPGSGSQPTTPSLELPQQQGRPGTSGFLWNTSSFTSPQSGSKLKDVVPSPTTTNHPTGDKPFSPPGGEIDDGIGFLLNQQNPVRKSVRSQSYSIGQGDIENSPLGQFSAPRNRLRHRPSKPSLLGEGPGLGQLREDDLDEIESSNGSEGGMRLPTGYWEQEHKRDQEKGLRKQAAEQNARARYRAASTASPHLGFRFRDEPTNDHYAVMMEEFEDPVVPQQPLTRRFSEHVGVDRKPKIDHLGESLIKNPWGGSPTMSSVVNENLGRRHSFATYSTQQNAFQPSTLTYNEEDEDVVSPTQRAESPENQQPFDASAYFAGYGPASRAINASAISAAHPEPIAPQTNTNAGNPYAVPPVLGRPGRRLFVVTFKCSRADIYYLYDNTGLEIRAGDLVITEGDRGCDLGQVSHADVSLEDAKKFKAEALDEHFRWLVMFSQYSLAGAKDVGMLGALARANGFPNMNRAALTSMGGQQEQDTKPKMIKRLAQQHEIAALRDKEGSEAKAKRLGAQKAVEHKLPMEILDAEFQADYHKLTFFYYAENYVNFNALVTDVFKQYKIRIWMSAVNPASVVNPAGIVQIQPPSAIGPGAIMHSRTSNTPAAVGPGFGAGSYRQNEQQQQQQQQQQQPQQRGRANVNTTQGQYEQPYYPYAQQLGGYPVSQQYNMPAYNQNQYSQYDAYGRYPGYPSATGSGTPMNYGAYQPPTTYAASPAFNNASSGPSYRGGYPSTSSAPSGSYGGQNTSGVGYPSAAGYGNGYAATTASYDPSLIASMQGMNFNTN